MNRTSEQRFLLREKVDALLTPAGMDFHCKQCRALVARIPFGGSASFEQVDVSIERHMEIKHKERAGAA